MADDAVAWAAVHTDELVGMPVAEAQKAAEAAGLRVRVAGPDAVLTLEYRPDRITLHTDEGEQAVTAVRPG